MKKIVLIFSLSVTSLTLQAALGSSSDGNIKPGSSGSYVIQDPIKRLAIEKKTHLPAMTKAFCAVVNADGKCPIHFAARNGYESSIERFLMVGADINVQDMYGLTPLHMAVIYAKYDIVKLLLNNGADATITIIKECEENDYWISPGVTAADIADSLGYKHISALMRGGKKSKKRADYYSTTPADHSKESGTQAGAMPMLPRSARYAFPKK